MMKMCFNKTPLVSFGSYFMEYFMGHNYTLNAWNDEKSTVFKDLSHNYTMNAWNDEISIVFKDLSHCPSAMLM